MYLFMLFVELFRMSIDSYDIKCLQKIQILLIFPINLINNVNFLNHFKLSYR